jgi:hypothetical protein
LLEEISSAPEQMELIDTSVADMIERREMALSGDNNASTGNADRKAARPTRAGS